MVDGYHKTDLIGNLTKNTWNPRGTNLAMDWYYNGGDFSVSESGGQISISVDGFFWQNEGQYKVIDENSGDARYVNVTGDTMSGALTFNMVSNAINFNGSNGLYTMIKFMDNTSNNYGYGVAIGGGGTSVLGAGESSDVIIQRLQIDETQFGGQERCIIANDGNIEVYSNLQSGWDYRKTLIFDTNGDLIIERNLNASGGYFTSQVHINHDTDTNTSNSSGSLIIGPKNGAHLSFDKNEIMARSGSSISHLYLNADGGDVSIGGNNSTSASLYVNGPISTNKSIEVNNPNYSTETCYVYVNSNNRKCGLLVGTGGINRGLYDKTREVWMVYSDDSNTYLNGYATYAYYLATTYYWADIAISTSQNNQTEPTVKTLSILHNTTSPNQSHFNITNTTYAANNFAWASNARITSAINGSRFVHLIGKENSAKNQAYFGYHHVADGSNSNYATIGLYSVNEIFNITAGANVGIGTTTPSYKLHVHGGSIAVTSAADHKMLLEVYTGNDMGLTFWNNGYQKGYISASTLVINSASGTGNVGIGTTTPSYKLHVEGDIYSSNVIYTSSGRYDTLAGSNSGIGAIHLNNSDITGVNAISTSDLSDSWLESIAFKRSNGNWDTFRAADGNFYFGVNNGTEYIGIHSGNYTDYTVTKTGGGASGTWGINITGKSSYADAIRDPDYHDYGTRRTSMDVSYNDGALHYFLSTSSVTTGRGNGDAFILTCGWDNGPWSGQLSIPNDVNRNLQFRTCDSNGYTAWKDIAYLDHNHDSRYVKKSGDTMTGTLYINLDSDVSNSGSSGSLIIGNKNSDSIGIDGNEIIARNGNNAATLYLQNEGGNLYCYAGTNYFSGNVGIGTASPSYKLHVSGNIYSTGFRHSSVNSDSYFLLAGGGYTATSNYATAHSHPYLPLSGGYMTGNIGYTGSLASYSMIKFINNTDNSWGNGIAIGGGGQAIIGGGESSDVMMSQTSNNGDEIMWIGNDGDINFFSNLQSGWDYRKEMKFDTGGDLYVSRYVRAAGFIHTSINSDSYVLKAGGGYKAESSLSVSYASSAGSSSYATYLSHLSLTNGGTLNSSSGTFAFSSSSIIVNGNDYVGLQVGDSVDKFQITADGNNLYFRQNDSGGSNTSWNSWVTLLSSANWSSYITVSGGGNDYVWKSQGNTEYKLVVGSTGSDSSTIYILT